MNIPNLKNIGNKKFISKKVLRRSKRLRKSNVETERLEMLAQKVIAEAMTLAVIRKCWRCKKQYVKEGGCSMVRCICGGINCWECGFGGPLYHHHSCFFVPPERNAGADIKQAARYAKKNLLKKYPLLKFRYDPSLSFKLKRSGK